MKKIIIICLAEIFFCLSNAKADIIFPVTLNATGGSNGTYAYGVYGNNVVGSYTDASNIDHGFLYNGLTYTALNATGGTNSTFAYGISGNKVVGSYNDVSGIHGFLYNGSTYTALNATGGTNSTSAYGISGNNIVGSYTNISGGHGFLYNGSTYTALNATGGSNGTYAYGVYGNNVVGSYTDAINVNVDHGFFYNGSTYTNINVTGGTSTNVYGISGNNVVGSYNDSSGTLDHGFIYNLSTGSSTTIDVSGATGGTDVYGIFGNKIVGFYTDALGDHGFVETFPATHWATAVSGSWSDSTKWTGMLGVPNAIGVGAVINVSTTADLTVTLDVPQVVGTLLLGNSGSATVGYTIVGSGSNSLTFNNAGSDSTITVTDGSHIINAPVLLDNNLVVSGSGKLTFGDSSSITDNGNGFSLTLNDPSSTLILSGSDNYSGGTYVTAGTLILNSANAIPDGSSLTIGSGGLFVFDSTAQASSIVPETSVSHNLDVVPEPSTLILLISGLMIYGLLLHRKK